MFLRQSSWASREQIVTPALDVTCDDNEPNAPRRTSTSSLGATSNGGLFAKNRSLWERRSSQQNVSTATNVDDASDDGGLAVRGGFRSNRDFWEQRVTMRQKQTPDLVLDLPVNTLSTSPGAASTASTTATSPTAAVAPIPKPRPRPSVDRLIALKFPYDQTKVPRGRLLKKFTLWRSRDGSGKPEYMNKLEKNLCSLVA